MVAPPAGTTARLHLLGLLRQLLGLLRQLPVLLRQLLGLLQQLVVRRIEASLGSRCASRGGGVAPVCLSRDHRSNASPSMRSFSQLEAQDPFAAAIPGNTKSEVKRSAPPSAPMPGLSIALSRSSATASRPPQMPLMSTPQVQ
jgi:hypothetical protein